MVTEISKDIQSLDFSKKNLTATITDLKRFQMLVNAVEQLSSATEGRQYRTAGNLLQVI